MFHIQSKYRSISSQICSLTVQSKRSILFHISLSLCPVFRLNMDTVQLNMSENISMLNPTMFHPTEPPSSHLSSMRIPQSCDLSTPIFSSSLNDIQTTTGPSSTTTNPFECEHGTIASAAVAALNRPILRNPLSTFTQSYQSQNGHMMSQYGQTFGAMINPSMQSVHATQTVSQQQQQQQHQHQQQQHQQNITYNQTNFFLPIQTTNAINTAYFSANDQSHFIGQ